VLVRRTTVKKVILKRRLDDRNLCVTDSHAD